MGEDPVVFVCELLILQVVKRRHVHKGRFALEIPAWPDVLPRGSWRRRAARALAQEVRAIIQHLQAIAHEDVVRWIR